MKVQAFLRNSEESLMTHFTTSYIWSTQKVITYLNKNLKEFNIVWIKINGKKVINNSPKKSEDKRR